jgi:hypothetical protein
MKEKYNEQRRDRYANDAVHRAKVRDVNQATQKRYKEMQKTSPKVNLSRMATQAKRREGGNISTEFLLNMWIEQDGKCALTGLQMVWGQGVVSAMNVSIDRVDQSRGYFQDNVRLVCWCANSFRQQMSDKKLLEVAVAMVNTLKSKIDSNELIAKVTDNPLSFKAFV